MSEVFRPLSDFITPPAGHQLVISGGKYYFSDPRRAVSNLTPVPQGALLAARGAQTAANYQALLGSGLSQAAIEVYLGLETPAQAGLIPAIGSLVTINGAGQVIAWQVPQAAGNAGYVSIVATAPASPNFPVVMFEADASGRFVVTGIVSHGADSPGNVSPEPPEPDTPVANPLPSGIFVGSQIPNTDPAHYSTNADDTQPDGGQVLWLNSKGNGAPMGVYEKHSSSVPGETPMGAGIATWYEAVPTPPSLAGLAVG
ncbi:MAG TPA: hypothetical protein VG897_07900 [Terriglobales bacterium]|nr:hypothetical protein [Terriglobales bacterium]